MVAVLDVKKRDDGSTVLKPGELTIHGINNQILDYNGTPTIHSPHSRDNGNNYVTGGVTLAGGAEFASDYILPLGYHSIQNNVILDPSLSSTPINEGDIGLIADMLSNLSQFLSPQGGGGSGSSAPIKTITYRACSITNPMLGYIETGSAGKISTLCGADNRSALQLTVYGKIKSKRATAFQLQSDLTRDKEMIEMNR